MQFHPHGDASIGHALVQLGQKDLLVDCQGNWGNILTGDGAAAPRYIEARLSKFDGRFSGASRGASIGHVSPEAAVGGPIALVEEGDIIRINIPENKLDVLVSDEELAARRAKWQPREPKITTGYLARYHELVTSGNRGAVLEAPSQKN